MNKIVSILIVLIFSVISPNISASMPEDGKVEIFVYTPVFHHIMGDLYPRVEFDASIDKSDEKRLYVGSYIRFLVDPGRHLISLTSAGWWNKSSFLGGDRWKALSLIFDTKLGEKYFVRFGYGKKGDFFYRSIGIAPQGVVSYEFSQLAPAAEINSLIEANNLKSDEDE